MNWPENFAVAPRPRLGGSVGQKAAFYTYFAALNHEDFSAAAQFLHADVSFSVPNSQVGKGRDAVVNFLKYTRTRFRIKEEVRRVIADDAAICAEITCTLTAIEDALDMEGGLKKGETQVMEFICVYELKDGLIYKMEATPRK